MRPSSNILAAAGLLTLGAGSCVEPYAPEVVSTNANLLVVDGFINGNGRTRIRLTRSENIATTTAPPAQAGASLYILDDAGQRYPLTEPSPGYYRSDSLRLSPARRYQLRIGLGAATYASDLVALKVTPPLDKVELAQQNDQVKLLVSTHDPAGLTRYYRWRLAETWQFTAAYPSTLEVRKGLVGPRTTPIYTCYRSEAPSTIQQASTLALSQDVVSQQNILVNSNRSERFKIRYSVLVSQYAESTEEFAYNEVLRKNTEAVGTVNDPLPSQLTGNVHRLDNPQEPVLGFVGAHTVVQQRLFATPSSLGIPAGWVFDSPYADCTIGTELVPDTTEKLTMRIYRPHTRIFESGENIPTDYFIVGTDTLGYVGAARTCVDCRVRGTTTKPAYW